MDLRQQNSAVIPKTFKCDIVNICSVYSKEKKHQVSVYLKKYKPNIMMLSETNSNNRCNLNFNGYDHIRVDRKNKKWGGTAILYDENLVITQIVNDPTIESFEYTSGEVVINNEKVLLTSIYRPPNVPINNFVADIEKILNKYPRHKHLIAGDYNARSELFGDSKSNNEEKTIAHWLTNDANKFNVHLETTNQPTCWRSDKGSFIDFAIVSDDLILMKTSADNKLNTSNHFADHSVIHIELACDAISCKTKQVFRDFTKAEWCKLNKLIDSEIEKINLPISRNISNEEIDSVVYKISHVFTEAINKFVPCVKTADEYIKLSSRSEKLLKTKHTLQTRLRNNRLTVNFSVIKNEYKNIVIMLRNSIQDDYSEFFKLKLSALRPNSNVFKSVKNISGYKKREKLPNVLFDSEQRVNALSTDEEKATGFANVFAEPFRILLNWKLIQFINITSTQSTE